MISISSLTSTVHAEPPYIPYIWILDGHTSMYLFSGAINNVLDNPPVLSHTWEYSYSGLFDDTVSETILTDPSLSTGVRNDGAHVITGLEEGHEYFVRAIVTNEDGNSTSFTSSVILGSAEYTISTDTMTYGNGTRIGITEYSKIYYGDTLTISGVFLKDGLPFGGESIDLHVGYENTRIDDVATSDANGRWSTDLYVDLPIEAEESTTLIYGLYIDEFDTEYIGGPGFYLDYEFSVREDPCPEGYITEITDEGIICDVTNEWFDSEMVRMQDIVDRLIAQMRLSGFERTGPTG